MVYSFDLFDTLVCRSLQSPTDVFYLLERFKNIRYKNALYRTIGFYRLRRLAEIIARKKSPQEEVSFDEIYAVLARFIDNAKEVQAWEFDCELLVLHPIDERVRELKILLAQGKACCIISDMYLPTDKIKHIVQAKIGVDIPIFVSSEYMQTKHTGTLYETVKNHYQIQYSDMVHCGDNLHADIQVAQKLGITTKHVLNFNQKVNDKNIFNILKPTHTDPNLADNVFYELGFYLAAPCAWSVAKWIDKDLKKQGIKKVFFGARDGFIFEKFFREISDIPSEYIRVSRRSLFLPTFGIDDSHNYLLFEGDDSLTAVEFFERLNLVCPDELHEKLPNRNRQLFLDTLKNMGFFEICDQELKNTLFYLDKVGFLSEKSAFFDLGWRGSLQSALQKIVGERTKIFGYYFGLIKKKVNTDAHKAFYFYDNQHTDRKNMLAQSLAYFEFIFTEPEQSLKSLSVVDNQVVFNFLDNTESDDVLAKRQMIVRGAMDFLQIIKSFEQFFDLHDDVYIDGVDKQVRHYINYSSEQIIDEFTKIEHSAAFGGAFVRHIVEKERFSVKAYRQSFWRSGYVRSIKGVDRIKANIMHFIFYKLGLVSLKAKIKQILDKP